MEILISNDTAQNAPKSCFLSFFWYRPHNHPHSISDSSSSRCYHSNCLWKMESSISEQWPDTIVITHPCHRIAFLYTHALILARFLQIGLVHNTFLEVFSFFPKILGSHHPRYNQIHWQKKEPIFMWSKIFIIWHRKNKVTRQTWYINISICWFSSYIHLDFIIIFRGHYFLEMLRQGKYLICWIITALNKLEVIPLLLRELIYTFILPGWEYSVKPGSGYLD